MQYSEFNKDGDNYKFVKKVFFKSLKYSIYFGLFYFGLEYNLYLHKNTLEQCKSMNDNLLENIQILVSKNTDEIIQSIKILNKKY